MSDEKNIRELQLKILEMMKFIDKICRENGIMYYTLGGTSLGAVRHQGFIPWDDDMDIFMKVEDYEKFKKVFYGIKQEQFFLQEWKMVDDYVQQSKMRFNGTTLIESAFKHFENFHQGIFIDIFILHKCPKNNIFIQKKLYYYSHFLVGVSLSQRRWFPRTNFEKIALFLCKKLGKKPILRHMFKLIYKYDKLEKDYVYCCFLDREKFKSSMHDAEQFDEFTDNKFEDMMLYGPKDMNKYLIQIYGEDYMELPPPEKRNYRVHAEVWDTNRDYTEYLKEMKERGEL